MDQGRAVFCTWFVQHSSHLMVGYAYAEHIRFVTQGSLVVLQIEGFMTTRLSYGNIRFM